MCHCACQFFQDGGYPPFWFLLDAHWNPPELSIEEFGLAGC